MEKNELYDEEVQHRILMIAEKQISHLLDLNREKIFNAIKDQFNDGRVGVDKAFNIRLPVSIYPTISGCSVETKIAYSNNFGSIHERQRITNNNHPELELDRSKTGVKTNVNN
jgi:hypothetical protein